MPAPDLILGRIAVFPSGIVAGLVVAASARTGTITVQTPDGTESQIAAHAVSLLETVA